jgi:hypothetical protein
MRADTQSFEFKRAGYEANFDSRHFKPNTKPDRQPTKCVAPELPPPGTMRWGVRSKAAVVIAIRDGMLTLEEACERYALSTAEYFSWESGFNAHGLEGLGMAGRRLRRLSRPHTGK